MRFFKKAIFIILFLLAACFILLHAFINISGKPLLETKLREALKKNVSIGSLSTSPPLNIYIGDISISGLLKVKEAYIGINFLDLFSRDLRLSTVKLTRPVLTFEKNLPEAAAAAMVSPMQLQEPAMTVQGKHANNKSRLYPAFSISRLIISDGTVSFLDKSVSKAGLLIKAERLNSKITNFSFNVPQKGTTAFEISADLPWKEDKAKGKFSWKGWINRSKGAMRATLKISDIDGIYLYPYYSTWFDLEKSRIEKAKLNFTSDMEGASNNLAAKCRLELTDIVRKSRPAGEEEDKSDQFAAAVMGILRALNQGKIVLDFTLRTKMDKLDFGFRNINMDLKNKESPPQ